MQPIQLFQLASQQAHWLSVRQGVVAGNISNVDTPGYTAMDVEPFQAVLERQATAASSPQTAGFARDADLVEARDTVEMKASGNSVNLAGEFVKAGEIRRDFQMNVGLVRSFHQMMMMTVAK